MGKQADSLADGMPDVVRDDAWEREVRREVVRAVVEREARSLPASIMAWTVLVIAAMGLPFAKLMIVPLALRLASLGISRWCARKLSEALERNEGIDTAIRKLTLAMMFAGLTWGLLLYPHEVRPPSDPSVSTIRGVVFVGIAIVSVTFGPLRAPMFALVGSFGATVLAIIAINAQLVSPMLAATVIALCIGIIAYALGAAKQHVHASEMLVDNRHLSEELAEALAQSEFLSRHDPLTGLLNRRAFFENEVSTGVSSERRHLLAIDLDHFKRINDEFGHAMGDRVLVATADEIRAITRPLGDSASRAVRLGGEEFALLLEGFDGATAAGIAEALRLRLERIPGSLGHDGFEVSASIGIAVCEPGETLDEALRRSDLAMYRAKDRGRNQVVSEAA